MDLNRDYNKEPIIIKDNNAFFDFLLIVPSIIFCIYVYIFNPWGANKDTLNRHFFWLWPAMFAPYILPYLKSRNKRKIVLTNEKIKFLHQNLIIEEIDLNKEYQVFKTYEPFYHKSQRPIEIVRVLWIILLPLTIFCFIENIINKFLYNLFQNRLKEYKYYDSIIILQDDKVINIRPNTKQEYENIKKYFINITNIDIENTKVFFNKYGLLYEKINYEELKNE
ncbi:putative membrane protein [Campylobacter blaseri]|uniref:Uncharacterized protein n=1 Tax=Campylobacter blaseri TaxID=2042961 RepID=A0A2P8R0G0_9BACT|nr:hypothetical protein [Campylobacter blaseri]PSM51984.1 hypothetical protein CQ405_05320 [Campylobacter blaseri]PSM53769.1 hypothetical protein CRN67_05320 [Campylobacter blaseri]QKF85677.1 putative membrane protein [Campylobacter blaseri]